MSDMLYDFLKWTDEYGSQDFVMKKFTQRKIPYVFYKRVRQSAAEQGLITGVINTSSGYFIPDDTSLTVKGTMFIMKLKELN